ncbi:MAG: DUF3332 family protein [Geobacteraceae bacterium]|nr:DUF3332 family protein [Geobacteraceae bacterium]
MKRLLLVVSTALLAALTLNGCYGKFALTRKLYTANGQIEDKFLRSGLTGLLLIVPVYGAAAIADLAVFNLIEFWTGKNPIVAAEKDFQYVLGDDNYNVHAVKSGEMVDYTVSHYNKAGLVETTAISWDSLTGRSAVSINGGPYFVREDQSLAFYNPLGTGAGQLALTR